MSHLNKRSHVVLSAYLSYIFYFFMLRPENYLEFSFHCSLSLSLSSARVGVFGVFCSCLLASVNGISLV